MRKLNFFLLSALILGLAMTSLTSCGDDEPCTDTALDFEGTWVGSYKVFIIPIGENDTLRVTSSGNTVTMTSRLLGGTTFDAEYDPITGQVLLDSIEFPFFVFEEDTFYGIKVRNGKASLTNDCKTMFLNLTGVSVDSGTINLPDGLEYSDLTNVTLSTDNQNPLKKQ